MITIDSHVNSCYNQANLKRGCDNMNTDNPPLRNVNSKQRAFDNISSTIMLTGGLTLSQLAEISGLETTTIQNWVKRGWVEPPTQRRYGESSAARVLIISMLRGVMQLSDIVKLMAYVNGKVSDRTDDAIPDSELYNILCEIIENINCINDFRISDINIIIENKLDTYREPFEGGKTKLIKALKIMTLAYYSAELKKRAEEVLSEIQ